MEILKKIKQLFDKSSKEIVKTGEELSEKAEAMGKEGVEYAREKMSVIGEKATDISNMVRYKIEVSATERELDSKYQELGELSFRLNKSGKWDRYKERFDNKIDEINQIKQQIDEKERAYQELRKQYSSNYEIKKLTDDLGQGDAVISQVIVSEKSGMAGKLLKENLLPKEALISVVKRGKEVIIPDGNTKLLTGDEVTVIGKQDDVAKVAKRITAG